METTSLQIELVHFHLFSKFSSLGNVYLFFILTSSLMFPWCRRFARSRFLPHSIAFDCGRLFEITLHYRLDIIRNFHFRFVNCKDWTIMFYQFKFSLTILCTIKQSVVTVKPMPAHRLLKNLSPLHFLSNLQATSS